MIAGLVQSFAFSSRIPSGANTASFAHLHGSKNTNLLACSELGGIRSPCTHHKQGILVGFWIVAGLAAFLLGLSKGGVPVVAMMSVPLLALYMDPALAAGLLLPLYIMADWYAIYLFRGAFSVPNLKILLPAGALGIVIGFATVSAIPADLVKAVLAIIGLSYLFTSLRSRLSKRDIKPTEASVPRGVFWGTLAGLTSYIAHSGGPPFQAYVLPQKLDKMTYLGTSTIFFTLVNLMKLPPFILAGQLDWDSLSKAVWLIPCALAGAFSGAYINRMLPEKVFFLIIEFALGFVSLLLLYEIFFH